MIYSKISLTGLYDYDPRVFDFLYLPEGVDKDTLVTNLLIDLADLEILYPNPKVLSLAIANWSKSRVDSWEKMNTILREQYDALHNYDREDIFTEKLTASSKDKVIGANASTATTTDNRTNSHVEDGSSISNESKTAYNSLTKVDTKTLDNTSEGQATDTSSGNGNTTYNDNMSTDKTNSTDKTITHTATSKGKLGNEKIQDLIMSELDLRTTDIYKIIEDEFKYKFCILVY